MAEIEDQNPPVQLSYSSVPDQAFPIRWWVVVVPFVLTVISFYVIGKGANDEPYMTGIHAQDFIEQVFLGSLACGCWIVYGVIAMRRYAYTLAMLLVGPIMVWSFICLLYGCWGIVGYLKDVGRM